MGETEEVPGYDDLGASDDSRPGGVDQDNKEEQGGRGGPSDEDFRTASITSTDDFIGDILRQLDADCEVYQEELDDSTGTSFLAKHEEWQGLLPPPEQFAKYPGDVQHKIVEWNDAMIVDTSRRANLLAKAEVRNKTRSHWLNFIVNVLFISGSLVSFIATGNPAALGFLAIPGITVAVNVYRSRGRDSDEGNGGE